MAPKPLVPADFGIENLYSDFHGNVVLKLQNKAEMKGNSMILKMNSPVFGDMFLNLEIRTLDMDDFSGAAVKTFLESLYTGEVEPNKELFRDVNKMANVFKVTWLISKCESYFCDLVQNTNDSDYNSMLFVFEEARFLKNSVRKPGFLEIVLEKLCKMVNKETMFIERYMTNYLDLSTNQLDLMIQIAGENVCIFMKIMKNNMEEQGLTFDEISKYLLQNINLVDGMEQNKELYEDLFDLLLEKIENISTADLKMLMKLNREVTREDEVKQQSKLQTRAALPTTSGTEVAPVHDIPNLFCSKEQFSGLNPYQFFDELFSSPDVNNLYMLFEAVEYLEAVKYLAWEKESAYWKHVTGELLQKIVKIKQERGWCAVVPEFLDSLNSLSVYRLHADPLKAMKGCTGTDSKMLVCTEVSNLLDLVTKEKMYKFYFKHPKTTRCTQPAQCGFLVKVTPVTKENPEQFNMQMVTDRTMYPADLHIHSDLISADNMYLAVEEYWEFDEKWYNLCISWCGKPVYRSGGVWWGGWDCRASLKVRLVVYNDLTN